ncbi:MAG: hypothetical protein Q9190_005947 [Brigantiaea leucoxantha]
MDLSDDSSFYGDEDHRSYLEQRALDSDPQDYWSNNHWQLPSVIAHKNQSQHPSSSSSPEKQQPTLYNPYENLPYARQLSESVPSFLSRLPPLTTPQSSSCPWIYIANPFSTIRPLDQDWAGLSKTGETLLKQFSETQASIEKEEHIVPAKKGAITRKLTPLRKQLEERLLALAREKKCAGGKWMLFPYPEDVNAHWELVAEATAGQELGTAAKVAPVNEGEVGRGSRSARLMCVYTKDFADVEDVKRVLEKLVAMRLVRTKGANGVERGIYYKADAFTHLGISSGNEWGLRPSMYSSREMLGEGKR